MSLMSAINSALSGLNAQAAQLTNISNNVANASTVGYKAADSDFESLVLNSGWTGSPDLAGVTATTQMDISTAGQIQTTGVSTDIAVNGNGFMVVNTQANGGSAGNYLLTQAGSFRPDANGNLVNAAGYYLQGQPLDANGDPIGAAASNLSNLTTVNISSLSATAQPTTSMTFNANLPSSDTDYASTSPAASSSSVTYYDALGNANSLEFQFVPSVPAAAGDPASNTWTLNIYDSAAGAAPVGSATLVFNASGADAGTLASVASIGGAGTYDPTAGTYTITTAGGQSIPIDIGALNSAAGITQFNGSYTATNMQQNGAPFGLLQGVSIGSDGVVTASFSNGTTRPIYQLDLALVPNPDGLTPVAGDAYAVSQGSGLPMLSQPGVGSAGTTEGGALEGSNVDISTQLTNMIETQQAYSSTAMVIQTGNQMMQVINHLNQ